MNFIKQHYIKLIIAMLLLVTAVSACVSVWALWFREAPVLKPDYAAKATEKNAEKIEDATGGEGTEIPVGGGKISLVYSNEVHVDLSEGTAKFLVGNLAQSAHNIVAEIVIRDTVIAQSGAILPGYRVITLGLAENAAKMLSSGVYNGKIRLYLYDAQTNEREMLSTEIEVVITASP
ncbi:MAG: hypothetical protein IJW21_00305 [Clostridia bacterium]|nr:hypothetical protein [Clostridia bacterium]